MKVAGIDIGHHTGKAVIIEDGKIISQALLKMTAKSSVTGEKVLDEALRSTHLSREEIKYIVATGHGRRGVSIAQESKAVVTCLAKGGHWLLNSARTVMDVGAEVCNIIELNDQGRPVDFQENDKCAAGSGIFFEGMSKFLKISLNEMSEAALKAENPTLLNSQCVIFCEQELITYIHSKNPPPVENLIAGIYHALAARLVGLARRVKIREDLLLSGGTARYVGFVNALEKELGLKLNVPENPEMVPAIGAALFAGELCS
jgi:predicted CoA-substrate-specific enzyme activase